MSLITIFVILLVAVFATWCTSPSLRKPTSAFARGMAAISATGQEVEDEDILIRQVTLQPNRRCSIASCGDTRVAARLQGYLDQAKVPWTVGRFFFYSALLMVVGATIGQLVRIPGIVGWIPGMLLGACLRSLGAYYKRAARFRRFEAMLPEAIDLMSRALRAGYALPSALVMVADEVPDPVGPEFRRTADELSYGLPFREAMVNMEQRFPSFATCGFW